MTLFPFLLLAAASPAPAIVTPAPVPPPGPIGPQTWVTNQDYPAEAIRAGESGTVAFRLDVDAAGKVSGCTVTASSGSATLDRATCDILRARARFEPALDRQGRAVASTWSSRFRWELPAGTRPPDEGAGIGTILVSFELSADGRVTGCSAVTTGEVPATARDTCQAPQRSRYYDYLRSLAPRFRTVHLGFGTAVGAPPVLREAPGEIILRRTSEVSLPTAPGGKPGCRTTAAVGEDPLHTDVCADYRARGLTSGDEVASDPSIRLFIDFLVRGVRR